MVTGPLYDLPMLGQGWSGVKRFSVPGAILLVAPWILLTQAAMGIEQPKFSVVKKDGDFELRQMVAYAVAETEVQASFKEAGNIAFWKLYHYIQGQNQGQKSIPMTALVGLQPTGRAEKIAMSAPVSQTRSAQGYLVSFTLPAVYSAETAPRPNDPSVSLRQVPARKVAVITYSGSWSESRYEQKKTALLHWIAAQGLQAKGQPILARYNPPYTLWFLRHNEVQLEVE